MHYERSVKAFLLSWPLASAIMTVYLSLSMLELTILTFLPPAVVLLNDIKSKKHLIIFSSVLTISLFPLDYLAHATGLWYVESSFYRPANVPLVEDFLWAFFLIIYVIGFHEKFFDDGEFKYFKREFSYIEIAAIFSILTILFSPFLSLKLAFPLAYVVIWAPMIVIPLIYAWEKGILNHMLVTTAYFFYVKLSQEIAALEVDAWRFPLSDTSILGMVEIFGHSMPVEEVTIYMIGTAPAIVAYHHLLTKKEENKKSKS